MAELRDQIQTILGAAYRIERELGGGGMSRVFVATEDALGRQIVIKVLPPEAAAGVNIARFRREILLAAQLQHPHLVPLLATGEVDGLPYYTMPLVEGESLRARLAHGELPIADVLAILRDVAKALEYAHGKGVVHRDIKPDNVLLTGGSAVVTDFGVAKALRDATASDALTSVGVTVGTPAYMAPEQAAADPMTDQRADIYAFGVMAYEALAGHAPFAGRTAQAIIARHAMETPASISTLRPATPQLLADLVMRCLEKRPADRPQSAREVLEVLDSVTPSGGSRSLTTSRSGSNIDTRRRAAIASAVFAVTLLGAVWMWQRFHMANATPRRVAVAPFENLTNDSSLAQVGRVAADWLTQGIAQMDSVEVVSTTTADMALRDAKPSGPDPVRLLANATHATAIVTGTVTRFGDSLRMSANVIEPRSGHVIRAIEPVAGPVGDPLVAIQALRERVLGSLASDDRSRRVSLSGQPPTYAAYRAYVEGLDRFVRYRDYAGGLRLAGEAVRLDSNFAEAYLGLIVAYNNGGMYDQAERILNLAELRRSRLSPTGRVELDNLRAVLHGDLESALRTATQLARRDSNPLWVTEQGRDAGNLLRVREALPALRAADSAMVAMGDVSHVGILAVVYHVAEDHVAALTTVERGRKEFPADKELPRWELACFAGLRQPLQAFALADTILSSITGDAAATLNDVLIAAMEFQAHHDDATARRLAQMIVEWAPAGQTRPAPAAEAARLSVARAGAFYLLGDLDSALAGFRIANRNAATVATTGYLTLIAVRQGDTARARSVLDSLGTVHPKWDRGATTYWRAAISAQLGDRARAIQLLKDANHEGQGMTAWHSDQALAALRGYPPFEALITPR